MSAGLQQKLLERDKERLDVAGIIERAAGVERVHIEVLRAFGTKLFELGYFAGVGAGFHAFRKAGAQ